MKLAYFSPLPPARSGIADHSAELLPHLGQLIDITVFTDAPDEVPADLQSQFTILQVTDYPNKKWMFDLSLYHMGNSSYHETIYQMSLNHSGVVVLHDASLHHFIAHRTNGQGNPSGYSREMGYALGMAGINQTWCIRLGQCQSSLFDLPLTNRLIDVNLGLIVHSEFARKRALELRPSIPIQVIPEMMAIQNGQSYRAKLGWPDDAVIFASLGQVIPPKQIAFSLQLLSQLKKTNGNIYYLIVGEDEGGEVTRLIADNGWQDWVKYTGYLTSLQSFVNWLLAADVVMNLRHPTVGETSATALRAMGAGKPLIVFDQGWYSEIPEKAALKVPVMDEAALATAVQRFTSSAELRQRMGAAGQRYIREVCAPEKAAAAYVAFIQQILNRYKVAHA